MLLRQQLSDHVPVVFLNPEVSWHFSVETEFSAVHEPLTVMESKSKSLNTRHHETYLIITSLIFLQS